MKLTDQQKQIMDGSQGPCRAWAMKFLKDTGTALGAEDLVPIRYALMMADTDAMGEAGVEFIARLNQASPEERRPRASLVLESRYSAKELKRFGLPQSFLDLDEKRLEVIRQLGCNMEFGHINHHSIPAPCFGESIAMGSTPTAIYMNSAIGARTNFEAGPAGLAAALVGYVPRWGLHLDEGRRPQRRFRLEQVPQTLAEWGALGAAIGRRLNSMAEIPLIEGVSVHPGALAMNHLGAALASFSAVGMFHMPGVTPEAGRFDGSSLEGEVLGGAEIDAMFDFGSLADKSLDVVIIGAPQMSWNEVVELRQLLSGEKITDSVALLAFTDSGTLDAARSLGLDAELAELGCTLIDGVDYFQSGSEPIRKANGWSVALTPSLKLANILKGAGYQAAAAPLDACIASARAGRVMS